MTRETNPSRRVPPAALHADTDNQPISRCQVDAIGPSWMAIDKTEQAGVVSSISIIAPLPFRVLFLAGAGILCWALNLHGLYFLNIDTSLLFDGYVSSNPQTHQAPTSGSVIPPYHAIYNLFLCYSIITGIGWCSYRIFTQWGAPHLVDAYRFIPGLCAFVALAILFVPADGFHRRERGQFIQTLVRCFVSRSRPYFADVIMADILTSYAKVLSDLAVSTIMILPGGSFSRSAIQQGLLDWMVPCIMALPYGVRFRQCLLEYLMPDSSTSPLYNAMKYLTAFPVIFLSTLHYSAANTALASDASTTTANVWYGENPLFRLWLLSVLVNSLFSFWWDVTNDWGLTLLKYHKPSSALEPSTSYPPSPQILSSSHPTNARALDARDGESRSESSNGKVSGWWGLRPRLLLSRRAEIYYFAMVLNLILRLTWSLKLSPHLHNIAELESGVFLMEGLEVARRWLWVYFRIEYEVIRRYDHRYTTNSIEEHAFNDFGMAQMNGF